MSDEARTKPLGNVRADLLPSSLKLVCVVDGAEPVVTVLPSSGRVVVGRSRDADVTLEDDTLSRHHAAFHIGRELAFEDLGSRNGSRVRGKAVRPHVRTDIGVDEELQLGSVRAWVTAATGTLRADVQELERERIRTALARCAGNQTKAARLLGISRRTLVTKLTQYDLPRPRKPR